MFFLANSLQLGFQLFVVNCLFISAVIALFCIPDLVIFVVVIVIVLVSAVTVVDVIFAIVVIVIIIVIAVDLIIGLGWCSGCIYRVSSEWTTVLLSAVYQPLSLKLSFSNKETFTSNSVLQLFPKLDITHGSSVRNRRKKLCF